MKKYTIIIASEISILINPMLPSRIINDTPYIYKKHTTQSFLVFQLLLWFNSFYKKKDFGFFERYRNNSS